MQLKILNRLIALTAVVLLTASGSIAKPNSFKDERDGQVYKTVKIGDQVWMAENLNYKSDDSYCYNDDTANCKKYGRLYTWEAAKSACPAGYHLPSNAEWDMLLSTTYEADAYLQSESGWKFNDKPAGTEKYVFNGLPAGYRDSDGSYDYMGNQGFFWSSTKYHSTDPYIISMNEYFSDLEHRENYNTAAFSVRCLNDSIVIEKYFNPDIDYGTLKDERDGQSYKTVQIGSQTWMAENLNYTSDDSYCYDDDTIYCKEYGRLYTWKAARKACPAGWHLPSDDEWKKLIVFVGGDLNKLKKDVMKYAEEYEVTQSEIDKYRYSLLEKMADKAGPILKSEIWESSTMGIPASTDNYGFNGLPVGRRRFGSYDFMDSIGCFWSSTKGSSADAYYYRLSFFAVGLDRQSDDMSIAYSVRCLKGFN